MSIASDLTRLATAKQTIKTAIEGKGVTVETTKKLDEYGALIDAIPTGGGDDKPHWARPDDWPDFDLLDPRKGAEENALFVLCDSTLSVEPFLSVYNCTSLERINLSNDGSWTVAQTYETTDKKICVWLDKSQKYTIFRCVGNVFFNASISSTGHETVFENHRNAVCGEILYGPKVGYYGCFGAMSLVSTNYYAPIIYLKLVDISTNAIGGNGWRTNNSIKYIEWDGCNFTAQNFNRGFEGGSLTQKVVYKDSYMKLIAAPWIGHYGASKIIEYDWSSLDPTNITSISYICQDWSLIREINFAKWKYWGKTAEGSDNIVGNGGKITDCSNAFGGCRSLNNLDLSCFDFSGVTKTSNMFYICWNMMKLTLPPASRNLKVSFDIHYFTLMKRAEIVSILNSLPDISGGTAQTLTMGATMLGKLIDDEKAIATNKGWTLA